MKYLTCDEPPQIEPADILCVALAHNEAVLLPEFLRHYRALGVTQFLFVNDRSTDATTEILNDARDVTVFTPVEGSTYKEHKRFWRAELLDTYCNGKWCVVPDVDEHLIFSGFPERGLREVITDLEVEGADAVQATMVDMYSANPVNQTRYDGGSLSEAFPFFDGPEHSFRILAPKRFRKKYPTPNHHVFGGMRQRLFMPLDIYGGSIRERYFRKVSSVANGIDFKKGTSIRTHLARIAIRPRIKRQGLFNLTKVPLVKWKHGLFFYNGAHALSAPLQLSRTEMALLHFCVATGSAGFEHKASRGEHANGSEFYVKMLSGQSARETSPVFEGTHTFSGVASLAGFVR